MKDRKKPNVVVEVSTKNVLDIQVLAPFQDFSSEKFLESLREAAAEVHFQEGGVPIEFVLADAQKFSDKLVLSVQMKNFNGVSFQDSVKTAPESRKKLFNSWSKFWSLLPTRGCTIK